MAKITTKIEHTLVLDEQERLTLIRALRYKASRVTNHDEEDALITILVGVSDGMAKRMAVRLIKRGYSGLDGCPLGTEFKAVKYIVEDVPHLKCVYIRGSSLAKATGNTIAWQEKQYLFVLGKDSSAFEEVV